MNIVQAIEIWAATGAAAWVVYVFVAAGDGSMRPGKGGGDDGQDVRRHDGER